jgi:hypothetical protein
MSNRRPWRRCDGCGGVTHWHDEWWVCDGCGAEWGKDHAAKYAAPDATPNDPIRTENPMQIATPRDVAFDAARRAVDAASSAEQAADRIAAEYGRTPVTDRPSLMALSQAADSAAILARQCATQAAHLAHPWTEKWKPGDEQRATELASSAHRYALDALTARDAAIRLTKQEPGALAPDVVLPGGITVAFYTGERDGRTVVQVDTETGSEVRVNLNDGPALFDGSPERDNPPGILSHS